MEGNGVRGVVDNSTYTYVHTCVCQGQHVCKRVCITNIYIILQTQESRAAHRFFFCVCFSLFCFLVLLLLTFVLSLNCHNTFLLVYSVNK